VTTAGGHRDLPFDAAPFSSRLTKASDGIWYAAGERQLSYPGEGYDLCFSIEENSYWFRHRNNCIVTAVRNFPPPNNGVIFDIGGGNGYVSQGLLQAGFRAVLVEPGIQGIRNARQRGVSDLICATTDTAGFFPHTQAAVGLFDVLEHIEHDLPFLENIRTLLQQNGRLYLTVPAGPWLWSGEDLFAGHYRRYTLAGISGLLESAGFEILQASSFFRVLTIPIFLLRALPFRFRKSAPPQALHTSRDHAAGGGPAGRILEKLLSSEVSNLKQQRPMQSGSSCLIVAQPHQ